MRHADSKGSGAVDAFHQIFYEAASTTWAGTHWLGIRTYKSPLDLWIYQEILFRLRPSLVVETGTLYGGSALFLATMCDLMGSGRVISIDSAPQPGLPVHTRLDFLRGSSTDPSVVDVVRAHADKTAATGPVVVILDSDHSAKHVLAELHAYQSLVGIGSYLIVEDTNINAHPVRPDFGPGPHEAVEAFLTDNAAFERDRDCERYLLTFNPGGFLRRTHQ